MPPAFVRRTADEVQPLIGEISCDVAYDAPNVPYEQFKIKHANQKRAVRDARRPRPVGVSRQGRARDHAAGNRPGARRPGLAGGRRRRAGTRRRKQGLYDELSALDEKLITSADTQIYGGVSITLPGSFPATFTGRSVPEAIADTAQAENRTWKAISSIWSIRPSWSTRASGLARLARK